MMNPKEGNYFNFGQFAEKEFLKKLKEDLGTPLTEQIQQVVDVKARLAQALYQKESENLENLTSINHLITTPPFLWRFIDEAKKAEHARRAKKGLIFQLESDHAINLAHSLLNSTIPQSNRYTQIPLSNDGYTTSSDAARLLISSKIAFSFIGDDMDSNDILKQAREMGSQQLLDALVIPDNVPLIPYSRKIAQRIMSLSPDYSNGGLVGSLPTRVTEVNAQYVYLGSNESPVISLSITRTP